MKKTHFIFLITLLVLLILFAWSFFPVISGFVLIDQKPLSAEYLTDIKNQKDLSEQKGLVGDSYNALNTLFSGLAFVGIIATIFLQSKELSDTRREMKEQTEELEKQNKNLLTSSFENKFFVLFKYYLETRDRVIITSDEMKNFNSSAAYKNSAPLLSEQEHKGIDAIEMLVSYFFFLDPKEHFFMKDTADKNEYFLIKEFKDIGQLFNTQTVLFSYKWMAFNFDHKKNLTPMLAAFNNLISYIEHTTDLDSTEKEFYMNFFRNQLSESELKIILYHCSAELKAKETTQPIIEKYGILQNIGNSFLPNEYLPYLSCNISAFGENTNITKWIHSAFETLNENPNAYNKIMHTRSAQKFSS